MVASRFPTMQFPAKQESIEEKFKETSSEFSRKTFELLMEYGPLGSPQHNQRAPELFREHADVNRKIAKEAGILHKSAQDMLFPGSEFQEKNILGIPTIHVDTDTEAEGYFCKWCDEHFGAGYVSYPPMMTISEYPVSGNEDLDIQCRICSYLLYQEKRKSTSE